MGVGELQARDQIVMHADCILSNERSSMLIWDITQVVLYTRRKPVQTYEDM